jgi:hypothetical protein
MMLVFQPKVIQSIRGTVRMRPEFCAAKKVPVQSGDSH